MGRNSDLDTGKVAVVFLVVAIGIGIQYGVLAGFLTLVALGVSLTAYLSSNNRR